MATLESLSADLTAAMKARDAARVSTLRLLVSSLKQQKIDSGKELAEADVAAVLSRAAKQRREAATQFRAGNRPELADKEEAELVLIESYLPKAMPEAEIESTLRAIAAEKALAGPGSAGALMKEFMARHRGLADGKLVQQVAARILAG